MRLRRLALKRRSGGSGMDRTYCDNCNEECAPYYVTMGHSGRPDNAEVERFAPLALCRDCVQLFARLDLEGFIERHRNRPRTAELP